MRRVGSWIGQVPVIGLCLLVVIETFFDLRRFPGRPPWVVSSYLVVHGAMALVLGVWWVCVIARRGRATDPDDEGRTLAWSAAALLGWALVSASLTVLPRVGAVVVPRSYLVVPVVTALVTFVAARFMVACLPGDDPVGALRWPAATLILCSAAQWPRSAVVHHSMRLATGLGGSAVVHLALLLATGVTAARASAARGGSGELGRARVGWLLVTVLGGVEVILTGSRAGVLSILLAVVLVLAGRSSVLRSIRAWLVIGAAIGVMALLIVAVPTLRRVLNPADEARRRNVETAMTVWRLDASTPLLGAGEGRLWPWYAFEQHLVTTPWRGLVATPWGQTLTSAHSTLLAVLVELGIVGALLLVPIVVAPVVALVRCRRHGTRAGAEVLLACVVATLPALGLDTYLLKNFGVSLWWWLAVLACLRRPRDCVAGPGRRSDR